MISLSQLNNQYLINLPHSCLRRVESGLTHKNSPRTTCGCSKGRQQSFSDTIKGSELQKKGGAEDKSYV